jgi:ABC-2 type transport system permease protein
MNATLVRALAEKDLRVVLRTRLIVVPMIVVPLLLLVLLPSVLILAPQLASGAEAAKEIDELLGHLPPELAAPFHGYTPVQMAIAYIAGYLWAPLFLIVPVMVAGGVAADSFAGERERKTLEALLHTPLSDLELFAGKVAAAWVLALAVALGSFVLYTLTVNIAGWPAMGRVFFPNATWLLLVAWVTPPVALLGLGVVVIISARVDTAHEAFQAGGLVVLPIAMMVLGQFTGAIFFGPTLVLVLGAVLWAVAILVLRTGFRHFRRSVFVSRV